LADYLDWPDVAQVGRVEAEVTRDGKTTVEVRYFITSVPRAWADAAQLLRWVRGHWSIENRTHYVRDVTLGEDASRVRQGSGPQVLAAVRNAALGLLRHWGGFESIAEAASFIVLASPGVRPLSAAAWLAEPAPAGAPRDTRRGQPACCRRSVPLRLSHPPV
jgi:hypothetical protein